MYFETFYLVSNIPAEKRIEFDQMLLKCQSDEELGMRMIISLSSVFYLRVYFFFRKTQRYEKNWFITICVDDVYSTIL